MFKCRAVIFDMDGVIVDNHHYHFEAWMEFSRKYNFKLNSEIYRDTYNGKTNADLFRMIFGDISQEKIRKYTEEKEGLYQELYASHIRPHKGLHDFLDYLERSRIKIALGTSAPTRNVDFTIDTLKLRKYFQLIVDGSQVSRGKPDPEVYQLCSLKLGIEPKNCIVFEDSLAGLESAQRAGCETVAVATSHLPHELRPREDKIIFDFTDVKSVLNL